MLINNNGLGSFTSATVILNISQSAISRQIQSLEDDLKVKLFERHARGLTLTENGEYVYKTAHDVISKLKEVGKHKFPPYDALNTTTLIKGNSHDELKKFEDNSIDILFIDGGHEYSVIKKDIEIGWEKVKPGGYICGDDYSGDYHLNKIDKVSKKDLEKDTIDGIGYIKVIDNNGYLLNIPNVHAGVIKAVHEFFNGNANVNNWGRYWYYKKGALNG